MRMDAVETTARHLRLLTETIAAVNSSLDLQEVLELVAGQVADALGTDACFVYLYDERSDELVLRATHGTRVGRRACGRETGSRASLPRSERR
jgi:signal transduction protein with GAF and PtsI domain